MSNPIINPEILVRHVSGSKKGQTETFSVTDDLDLTIGRGTENKVAYDPEKEDIVSRNHAVIRRVSGQQDTYEITDNQSRNGTFINDQRVNGKMLLFAGDLVRFGKDGPSFEFDLNPRPIKKTRVVDTAVAPSKETKVQNVVSSPPQKETQKESVGKQTMMHMLQESEKKSKKGLLITIIAILVVVGTAAWILFTRPAPPSKIIQVNNGTPHSSPNALTPAQIAKENNNKVVFIEAGWKLVYTKTGDDLFHLYMPVKEGKLTRYYAAYISNDGRIEPYLVTKSQAPAGADLKPIGAYLSGSGFVVDDRGFIITNRHVAASWLTTYHFPPDAFPGLLFEVDAKGELAINNKVSVSEGDVANWVPAEAMNLNRKVLESGVKLIDGVPSYMDVTFANNSLRTPAKIVRISNVHDVAMIKIDLPETLSKVPLFDNKNLETGAPVTVLGYPAMSPDQYVATKSFDAFNRNPNIVKVPVPTLSTGYIGRLIRGQASGGKVDEYMSTMGDYYQLTINSTGPGNSGGPMYDDQGRVIGIYSAGSEKLSYSIPIKYAIELMGTNQVIK